MTQEEIEWHKKITVMREKIQVIHKKIYYEHGNFDQRVFRTELIKSGLMLEWNKLIDQRPEPEPADLGVIQRFGKFVFTEQQAMLRDSQADFEYFDLKGF
jgi:hypothetical protein